MPTNIAFCSGRSAHSAHVALKSAVETMDRAKDCAVLWFGEIYRRQLFKELGYSSITMYARTGLGFSPARTSDFVSICQRLKKLPRVEKEVRNGRIGYTKARELVKVADVMNQDEWLDVARRNTRDDLAREVKKAKQEPQNQNPGQGSLIPVEPRPKASPPVRVGLGPHKWPVMKRSGRKSEKWADCPRTRWRPSFKSWSVILHQSSPGEILWIRKLLIGRTLTLRPWHLGGVISWTLQQPRQKEIQPSPLPSSQGSRFTSIIAQNARPRQFPPAGGISSWIKLSGIRLSVMRFSRDRVNQTNLQYPRKQGVRFCRGTGIAVKGRAVNTTGFLKSTMSFPEVGAA